ncbi:MAG: hypothetical protein HC923_05335, partial [Myxococcales bacterium]|nr:hypothetical protein [Myxococcales bacterium]
MRRTLSTLTAAAASDDPAEVAKMLESHPLRALFRRGHARLAGFARRLQGVARRGSFARGAEPWGLLESSERSAVEAVLALRFPEALRGIASGGGLRLPLPEIYTERGYRSGSEVGSTEAFVAHLEAWATASEVLGIAAGLQASEDRDVLPEHPNERTLRVGFATALANVWLGREFRVDPLEASDVAVLARSLEVRSGEPQLTGGGSAPRRVPG